MSNFIHIQNILSQMGYQAQPAPAGKQGSLKLYCIHNPDGTIRWVWPDHLISPLFLKFYHTGSSRALWLKFIWSAIFKCRLQSLFFHSENLIITSEMPVLQGLHLSSMPWALFTGTPGPNNKLVVYTPAETGGVFHKIATSETSKNLLQQEAAQTAFIQNIAGKHLCIPKNLNQNTQSLSLSDISEGGIRCSELTAVHIEVLKTISKKTLAAYTLSETPVWQNAMNMLAEIRQTASDRTPVHLVKKLETICQNLKDTPVLMAFSHGDFTPWNTYLRDQQLSVYDWELSKKDMPLGYDAFHFLVQQGILVERSSWAQIRATIEQQIPEDLFGNGSKRAVYLQIYLCLHCIQYLHLYLFSQKEWHAQVQWQLDTWNDALSDIYPERENLRPLLLGDIVTWLQYRKYALIKSNGNPVETLSPHSDLDLCIGRRDAQELVAYLKQHSLVAQMSACPKSYMHQIALSLTDGSVLHLDLIWQIKWKNLEMMDIQPVLERAITHQNGVRTAHASDNARYIAMFYGLNRAQAPLKYQFYAMNLRPEDQFMTPVFYSFENHSSVIIKNLKNTAANKGLKGLLNTLNYIRDTLRTHCMQTGMTVTFSGVDGAGKSTVIEKVCFELEKKYRQKVVVLRHRPGLFPILSAWRMGRKKAESEAAARLPRQGTNNSVVSSLFRFAYYYMDYLLGQFYVHFRYIRSGHIVLYDRYYFDFMADSRRSNLQIPNFIPRLGFLLVSQPEYNFFLYADPETILSRKQELDYKSIEMLSGEYLNLFKTLGHDRPQRYFALKNQDLNHTIPFILSKITRSSAIQ